MKEEVCWFSCLPLTAFEGNPSAEWLPQILHAKDLVAQCCICREMGCFFFFLLTDVSFVLNLTISFLQSSGNIL